MNKKKYIETYDTNVDVGVVLDGLQKEKVTDVKDEVSKFQVALSKPHPLSLGWPVMLLCWTSVGWNRSRRDSWDNLWMPEVPGDDLWVKHITIIVHNGLEWVLMG